MERLLEHVVEDKDSGVVLTAPGSRDFEALGTEWLLMRRQSMGLMMENSRWT